MEQATVAPNRYRGSLSQYLDIGVRAANEFLGVSFDYARHPKNGDGFFIVRFVSHGKGALPKNFKHLTFRQSANFLTPTGEVFRGLRLNKVAVPAFSPAVYPNEVGQYGVDLGAFSKLAAWVIAQATAEGFLVTVDLEQELVNFFAPKTTGEVKDIFAVPDLAAPEQQAYAAKLAEKPVYLDDEEDADDEDGDIDSKGWVN